MREQCLIKGAKPQTTRGATIGWQKDYGIKNRPKDDWNSPPKYMEEISG